jgi:hypothetical protein
MKYTDFNLKDIWNDIATNLSQKINMPRNNVFLVHLSKYQEPAHDASQQYILPDPCLKNKSCSIGQLTFDSSQQGKTSIGIAVLTNVENIYSILGTIRYLYELRSKNGLVYITVENMRWKR